jgi:aryl-alcohol dehydrogenase-like predicted oxidoreductase
VAGPYQDVPRGLRAVDIVRECDKSLRRLRSEYIDLYYAHVDDRDTPLEEIVEAFSRLVASGKVRFVGVSNWHTWRVAEARLLAEIRGWSRLAALEFRHSYLRPVPGADFGDQVAASDQLMDFARTYQLTLVAYSVLLNGAYGRTDRQIPEPYRGQDTQTRLAALHTVAGEVEATPSQVVLAWMLRRGQRIIPIIGGSTPAQIRGNIAASSVRLSDDQCARLDAAGTPA